MHFSFSVMDPLHLIPVANKNEIFSLCVGCKNTPEYWSGKVLWTSEIAHFI